MNRIIFWRKKMELKKILLGIAITAATFGCQSHNAYTGEQQTNKASIGAGVGAVGGALAGVLFADSTKGTLIGSALGAAAGAGIGAYMDNQEADLRRQLLNTGVQVERNGDQINLIMPGNITFDSSKSDIKSSFYDTLISVSTVVDKYNETEIIIIGHTDSTGSLAYNNSLSQQRANSVASFMMTQNVDPSRMQVFGVGPNQPIASNKTEAGKQANRRVEISLRPISKT